MTNKPNPSVIQILSVLVLLFGIGGLIVRTAYPEPAYIGYSIFGAFGLSLLALLWNLRTSFNKRTAMFGLNSLTTVALVLGILGVLNFLGMKYPKKFDLTKNKINTLSDQTEKVFRGLTLPVKFVFWTKLEEREKLRPLFDNLKSYSTKVEVEYVDTVKEIARAKAAGIQKDSTLQVFVGTRNQHVEAPTEEKITNAVIKLLRNNAPLICWVTEHGEKDYESKEGDGYALVQETLAKQGYDFKKLNLISAGKIPENCSLVAVIGPTKAFFEPEVKLIQDFLTNGGAAIFALDLNLRGPGVDASPELTKLLATWSVESDLALAVDPISQKLGLEATVPIIPTFSKEIAITKEMQGNSIFPLTRSFRISKARTDLRVNWLTQTTPNAWGETDIAGIAKGSAKFDEAKDLRGPLYTSVAVQSEKEKKTRIVAFGTSLIAANQWTRSGNNLDLFANAVSWLLEDESLISIRPKEDVGGTIQLSAVQGGIIQLVTVLIIPGVMILLGIVVWWRRKKL